MHSDVLAGEWHPEKNGALQPSDVTFQSHRVVWWQKSCTDLGPAHEWRASVKNRTKGQGCAICNGRQVQAGVNDLRSQRPEIAAEWHPTKNGALTPDTVTCGSKQGVWWRRECVTGAPAHEWRAEPKRRTGRTAYGCAVCSNHQVQAGVNDLETLNPDLASEWHPIRNGDLRPCDVASVSNKVVWWQCTFSHEWKAPVGNRAAGRGCPVCRGRVVLSGFNDIATTHPLVAQSWHPSRNGDASPDQVSFGSNRALWWLCDYGHEWRAAPNQRCGPDGRVATGCKKCNPRWVSRIAESMLDHIAAHLGLSVERESTVPVAWIGRAPGMGAVVDGLFDYAEQVVAIEYDGYPWHGAKPGVDERKTRALLASGYVDFVVRVRDHRLPLIDLCDARLLQMPHRRTNSFEGVASCIAEWLGSRASTEPPAA